VSRETALAPRIRALIDREPLRYLLCGGLCAVVNNIILIGGDGLGLHYALLTAISWALAGSLGYGLNARFTFRQPWRGRAYLRFMGGVALGVPLSLALLALFVSLLRLPMWFAAPASTLLMMVYNYANARLAIMRRLLGKGSA